MFENIFVWLGGIATVLTIITSYLFFSDRKLGRKKGIYISIRSYIKKNRSELCNRILNEYSYKHYQALHHLMVKDGWILKKPLLLTRDLIAFESSSSNEIISIDKYISLPLDDSGNKINRFSEAVRSLEKPKYFENRPHYRLLDYNTNNKPFFKYHNQEASYFDKIDFGSALEYEYGRIQYLKSQKKLTFRRNKLRKKLKSSVNIMEQIKVLSGISTLTLLQDGKDLRFIMHQRKNVGYADGVFHVSPAGEFQPESESPEDFLNDFDFWKNIMREYAEEIGLKEEYEGNSGFKTDYEEAPFNLLNEALAKDNARMFFLGFGLDPLSLQGEILTVCIFKYDTFKEIFPKIVDQNKEGVLRTEKEKWGIPFTDQVADMYLNSNTLQAGKAVLEITKSHLDSIVF